MGIYPAVQPDLQCDLLFPDLVCNGQEAESGLMEECADGQAGQEWFLRRPLGNVSAWRGSYEPSVCYISSGAKARRQRNHSCPACPSAEFLWVGFQASGGVDRMKKVEQNMF